MVAGLQALPGPARAPVFNTSCTAAMPSKEYHPLCHSLAASMTMQPDLALRAGAICAKLGFCSPVPNACTYNVTSKDAAGRPTLVSGPIDLCTMEGVAGGATPPELTPVKGEAGGLHAPHPLVPKQHQVQHASQHAGVTRHVASCAVLSCTTRCYHQGNTCRPHMRGCQAPSGRVGACLTLNPNPKP